MFQGVRTCLYARGDDKCKNPAIIKPSRSEDQKQLCKFHSKQSYHMWPNLFYSQSLRKHVSSQDHKPQRNDLKYEFNNQLKRYDGKSWRACCVKCEKFARPKSLYCRFHDPDVEITGVKRGIPKLACRFIDYYSAETKVLYQHKHLVEGQTYGHEVRIPGSNYFVDGCNPERKIVLEFLGDYWHGNPKKFDHDDINQVAQKTFGELWQETYHRLNKIHEAGYQVIYIWESDFLTFLKQRRADPQHSIQDYIVDYSPE